MSLSPISNVATELGPMRAPPVAEESSTVKVSTGSCVESLVIAIAAYLTPPSPSAQLTVTGSPVKSSPAAAVPAIGVIVTVTAPVV
jgi:hypothetical protein